jgi:elongation factor 2
MRAVDGVVIVVDAVEGTMPQTETVIRQALKENVKPVLFINKVDRLINELQVTAEAMQERFVKTIAQVNRLIKKNAPEGLADKWQVNPANGTVGFGSAYHNWAVSVPIMEKTGIKMGDVYNFLKEDRQKELAEKSPLHEVLLNMVVQHLPNPVEAQNYRIEKIWTGEKESEVSKNMRSCSEADPLAMMITDVTVDKHAGDIASGRIYAGTIKKGTKVKLIGSQKEFNVQKVGVFMGPEMIEVEEVPAGNIGALVGCKEAYAGETVSTIEMQEFEAFMSNVEPVITVSVEAKQTKDLPKLIQVIRQLTNEDPNIKATINQETGEHLLSGMGELHLEVTQYRIEKTHGVPITASPPIVVYHETINKESPTIIGKSPNKHNKFKMIIEPIEKELLGKLVDARINQKIRAKDKDLIEKFTEMGFGRDESKKIWCVHNNNILIDMTRGIQALHEVKELIIEAFQDAMNAGPLAKEKCFAVRV